MKRIFGILAVSMIAFAVRADTVTNSITRRATWSTNNPTPLFQVDLQQLDTNYSYFGSILSIEVGIYATNSADFWVENDGQSAQTYSLYESGGTTATNPGPKIVAWAYSDLLVASTTLASSNGVSHSGPDYVFYDDLLATGASSQLVEAVYYSLYIGSGTFGVDVVSRNRFSLDGVLPYSSGASDSRSLGLAYVTYTYTLVPEPGAWIALAAATIGVLIARRRRTSTPAALPEAQHREPS